MNNTSLCNQAILLIQSKEHEQAQELLSLVIKSSPQIAEAQELMGLSLSLQNKNLEAKEFLSTAIELEPKNPRYLNNLGEIFRKLGEYEQAETALKSAITNQNNYQSAQYNLACNYIGQKKYRKAFKRLRTLIKKDKTNSQYHIALADVLRELNKIRRAIKHYELAIKLDPDSAKAHSNLGPLLLSIGKIDDALIHCRKAVDIAPINGLSHLNLGRCLSDLEQYDEAMEAYADAYDLIPDNAFLLTQIAKNWSLINDLIQAEYWFMQAIEKDPEYIVALCGLADTHREGGLLDEALEEVDKILDANPKAPQVYQTRAQINLDLGNIEHCLEDYQQLIKLKPNHAAIYSAYGHALENAGDLKAAEKQFRMALKKNPACIPALSGLANTQRGKLLEKDAEAMLSLLEHRELRDGAKASLHSGLGYYLDGAKRYDEAANHITRANNHYWISKSNKGWTYEVDQYRHQVDKIIETFDTSYFSQLGDIGHSSSLPTYILGMPRSGTTLTEQILNAHPQILGVGERSFASESFGDLPRIVNQPNLTPLKIMPHLNKQICSDVAEWYLSKLQALEDKSGKQNITRIVDKMPDNYSQIGWILTLFPNAKIIHAKRDVRDIAVSCWMTQFGKIRWAFNLDHLAERIVQYDRLMKHWRSVIPSRFIETSYEDMILDQEDNSRRIINFLDLPWDEKCLSFHKQDVVVRTASVTQVRQPLYKKSLQRWKRYEVPLKKVFDRLYKAGVNIREF